MSNVIFPEHYKAYIFSSNINNQGQHITFMIFIEVQNNNLVKQLISFLAIMVNFLVKDVCKTHVPDKKQFIKHLDFVMLMYFVCLLLGQNNQIS